MCQYKFQQYKKLTIKLEDNAFGRKIAPKKITNVSINKMTLIQLHMIMEAKTVKTEQQSEEGKMDKEDDPNQNPLKNGPVGVLHK